MVRVLFLHPDLGIGGAERLVIDASLALKSKGHGVSFITSHHDPDHCFPETVDGTLDVTCIGDWLPRSTFGRLLAFWAYLRMIYISMYLLFFTPMDYDVLFVDQVSASIPILRLKQNIRIIFYCHYPDQLLTERKSYFKKLYRSFIDKIEEVTTGMADVILVNSKFTANVFMNTFKSISSKPSVLYPSFDFSKYEEFLKKPKPATDGFYFLSLNRYERKKNISLAIRAFHLLKNHVGEGEKYRIRLVIAGGYDPRVIENIEYFSELVDLAQQLDISDSVEFLKSPSDQIKMTLLSQTDCLIYTPNNEHFGIVPIEAMYLGTPVLAVNSGGPTETLVDGETGFLREQTPEAFAEVLKAFVEGKYSKSLLSENCRCRVISEFSFDEFANKLDSLVRRFEFKIDASHMPTETAS